MILKANTFNVIFHLVYEREKNEKSPVYARITINGKRIEISVKQMIAPDDWNDNRGLAKTNKEENKVLNNYLEELRSPYVACYREMALEKKIITVETFKKQYYGINDDEYTLCKLMNYHNIEMKEALCWGHDEKLFYHTKIA